MGKGMTVFRSHHRKHVRIRKADKDMQTSLAEKVKKVILILCTKREISGNLVRENRTQGSERGQPRNRLSYLTSEGKMEKIISILLFFSISFYSQGRGVQGMSFEDMKKKADLIVIATPLASQDTKERTKLHDLDTHFNDTGTIVIGVNTTFLPLTILKGELPKEKSEFIMHHYRFKEGESLINGPLFVSFKDFKKQGYLMFLKKEKNGKYSPVNGQYDPKRISIRKLEGTVFWDLLQKNIDFDEPRPSAKESKPLDPKIRKLIKELKEKKHKSDNQ